MTKCLPRRWRVFSLAVITALFWNLSTIADAQTNALNNGFTLDFVKSDGLASVDDVVTNVVKAVNRTARPVRFNLDLASPQGWKVINNLTKLYTVRAGDSLFIPVRMIPSKESAGNVNYFISATAYSEFGNALASTPWSVSVKKITKWNILVEERQVYFTNDSDSTDIHIRMTNEGNSVEKLRVSFFPDQRLRVLDPDWKPVQDNALYMELPVGADTSFVMHVKIADDLTKGYFFTDRPDDDQDKLDSKKYRLQIQAASTDDKSRAKGRRVNFTKLTSQTRFDSGFGSTVIPLTVELRSFNVLSEFTNFSLDFRGSTDLGRNRYLQYSYQSIITSSVAGGTRFSTANRFLQYTTPNYSVALGNIGENMGVFISGVGGKASVKYKKFEVGAIHARNASRGGILAPNDLTFYAGRLKYEAKKGSDIELQYINQIDNFSSVDGDVIRLQANHRISKRHRIGLVAGYSIQNDSFNPDSLFRYSGFGGELRYAGGFKKLNVSLNGAYYSELFLAQNSGRKQVAMNLRYPLGKGRSVSFRGGMSVINPVRIRRGRTFNSELNRRDSYELRYEWRANGATMQVSPRHIYDELLGLRVSTTGMGVGFSKTRGKSFRLFSRFFAGVSQALDFDISAYPVAKWENRLRYKNLNLMARYNYGPASITENFRVINDRITPQSLFLSAYASLYFRKQRFLLRPRLNSRYESVFARWRTNVSNEFLYYANSGYVFTIGTELLRINQGESPLADRTTQNGFDGALQEFQQSNFFLRIGVKKQFGFKRPGGKSYDVKVIVFKDADGNGVQGKGEELVENVLIKINDKAVITNSAGQAEFKDLIYGQYLMESDVLGDTEGWFKSDDNNIFVEKSKTVYIPLTRGVQIAGNVLAQKATYSRFVNEVNLSGIRITAIGKDGKVYSGLTDRSGKFRMFVPFGQYVIKASGATIDDQFQFAQDTYELGIDNADSNYQLTYYLIEKRRKLNIKKFN